MRVTIGALGSFRRFLPEGQSSTTVDLPEGSTVADALSAIGVPRGEAWNAGIEGQIAYADRVLEDGERLLVFPPIAGGCCRTSMLMR